MFAHKLRSFKFNPPPIIGVDISADAVKIMVLARQADTFVLRNFAIVSLPANTLIEKRINQPSQLPATIKQALQLAKCQTSHIAISMPTSTVVNKFLLMSATLTDEELEEEIGFAAEKYLPYALEDMCIDFHVLGPIPADPRKINVLLIASLKSSIQERVNIFSSMGTVRNGTNSKIVG